MVTTVLQKRCRKADFLRRLAHIEKIGPLIAPIHGGDFSRNGRQAWSLLEQMLRQAGRRAVLRDAIIAGNALLVTSQDAIRKSVHRLTQGELLEDPA